MKYTKNDEAVSPVIGVILMVAITVILAAVIAAFVFGMAGNINKTKVVSATAARVNVDTVSITYQGGQDAPSLTRISFSAQTPAGTDIDLTGTTMYNAGDPLTIGKSLTITANTLTSGSHIIGVGTFLDGSKQVIIDTKL